MKILAALSFLLAKDAAELDRTPTPPPCPVGFTGAVTPTDTTKLGYENVGRKVDIVLYLMGRAAEKAYGGQGHEFGWYTYHWTADVRFDQSTENPAVSGVCLASAYHVHLPKFKDRKMRKCFSELAEYVEWHELEHTRITQKVIVDTANSLVGLTRDEAQALLNGLDSRIAAANRAFHDTPEGAGPPRSAIPNRKCGLR